MTIFNLLTMVGGLALFLYGMKAMGDSLVLLSGGKLERILEKLTKTRLLALLLGALVTAVIQSSSATTVMVVGFVNSAIMNLQQAAGVIMGANIGTTITSWLLSLTGIDGSNVFLRLLKPSSFTPVLGAVGIILIMTQKDGSKKKTVGEILLGFTILMFGMETMSSAVKPLADNEAFTGILTAFSNPILGMLAGALLTAVIQSSSASVGILQALCMTGAVTFGSALPIIMGQNIGTCVTALISSAGASKNARRASLIHLYFNLIGTVLFMSVFYLLNAFIHFDFLETAAGAAGIAVIHSLFNIGCAAVLFPFANQLVRLATLTVPDKPDEVPAADERPAVLKALDERFLDRPSFAMQLCKRAVDDMAASSCRALHLAMSVFDDYSDATAEEVIDLEQRTDLFEDVLGSYLVKLSGRDLNDDDSRLLSVLLHSISDFERIGDHAINIVESAQDMKKRHLALTQEGHDELMAFGRAVEDIVDITTEAFLADDAVRARKVEPLEEVVDTLSTEMKQRHILRLRRNVCSLEAGLILEDIITIYERVSDHCSNVAVSLIEIRQNEFDPHAYLNLRVKGSDPWFQKEYQRLKDVYKLPQW
ncbi:MAG: Na/Pi cotransporter family protein [Lachnospiraceae bacterium]|nr:Na/Pi cotransporter family protein [Lachnospiraceae bacterium]